MIFPETTLAEWTKKTGLEPETAYCSCGKRCSTTIPFLSKEYYGLGAPKCEKCGDDMPALIVCGRTPEKQAQMNSFLIPSKD
jgi:hypothetical protein